MTERPSDPTAPVTAVAEPAVPPGSSFSPPPAMATARPEVQRETRSEDQAADPHVETHATFWQRIEEATREQPRGDGFDAWETRFQRPAATGETAASPATPMSGDGRSGTSDPDPLVTWTGGAAERANDPGDGWGSPAESTPVWDDLATTADRVVVADDGMSVDAVSAGDPLPPDAPVDTVKSTDADEVIEGDDVADGSTAPLAEDTHFAHDDPTRGPADRDRVAGEGSLLGEMRALATSLDTAAGRERPEFDRQVGELREILERARSRPRDIDTMMQLSERLDTITELAASHERMAAALREAARQLGGPAR